MKFFKIIKFILNHPFNSENKGLALLNFFKWQLNCILNPYPIIYPLTENSKILIKKGLTGATGNLYCGLMEFEDMSFLLHFLRPNDLFVDIGANVGAYSILASAEIKANTIAIEPIPSTFSILKQNISLNEMESKTKAFNIGVGSKNQKLFFTKSLDTVNHVDYENRIDTIEIEVKTLDYILLNEPSPTLLKIDVEGFETEVLLGSENTLKDKNLKAVIIELNGSGKKYSFDDIEIHMKFLNHGFKPFKYNPKQKSLIEIETFSIYNTIYIRDIDFVKSRIDTSRNIIVGNTQKSI
jgi:FkbM family methyltransferase